MSSRSLGACVLSLALAAAAPQAAPPPDLAERTRGPWIDVYRSWVELPGGGAMPVDPGPVFCVGTAGFAVIDQNAVADSLHLFATIRLRGPFAVRVRAFDPRAALAAIQLDPATLEGTPCLQLPGADVAPLAAGDVLFALGPGGADATPLRVKKVSADALTFARGLQGTFLAGSPLVDANGLLRGVLVAGTAGGAIGREKATGPLAGLAKRRHATSAVPIEVVLTLVDRIRKQQEAGMPAPPPDPVVRASREVFPRSMRRAAEVTAGDLALYSATSDELTLEFLTPPSLEAQQAAGTYGYAAGRTFFRWPAHTQMWEPMVVVQPSPHLDGTPTPSAASVVVERGGERIEPYDSFVEHFEDDVPIETAPGTYSPRAMRGTRIFHLFPPEAFTPGAEVVVRLALDRDGKAVVVPVRPETLARIAADFAPWRAAVAEIESPRPVNSTAPRPEAVVTPAPPLGTPYATIGEGHAQLRITQPVGCSFVVTRLERDGKTVFQVPVTLETYGLFLAARAGDLYIGREEISFEPSGAPAADKHVVTIPRAGLALSITDRPRLRIQAGKKRWLFDAVFHVTQRLTLGEVFGAPLKEARAAAVELTAKLLGDFDLALRAFDDPGLLESMPSPKAPDAAPAEGGEAPDFGP